jgi:ABC-2 type transport system ATP-binding protein
MEPAPATVSVARFRKRAKVKTSATAEQVTQALTGLPNIFEVSPSPGHCVLVSYTGDEQVLASIVKAMVMADLPVAGIEPERNELERIFMEVTKGEVQ